MIKITVHLSTDHESKSEEITITKEDIRRLACKKAERQYEQYYWDKVFSEEEMTINIES